VITWSRSSGSAGEEARRSQEEDAMAGRQREREQEGRVDEGLVRLQPW
jgi:hypothetical protein